MAEKVQKLAKRSREKVASRSELLDLVYAQEFRCALSGAELTPDDATLDHKLPVANGGDHSVGNLQVVSNTVNRMKGTMTHDEFVAWCKRVAAWNS